MTKFTAQFIADLLKAPISPDIAIMNYFIQPILCEVIVIILLIAVQQCSSQSELKTFGKTHPKTGANNPSTPIPTLYFKDNSDVGHILALDVRLISRAVLVSDTPSSDTSFKEG